MNTSSLLSSRLGQSKATAQKATDLHAKASPDFAAKLAETEALLQYETIDTEQIDQIMAGQRPEAPKGWTEPRSRRGGDSAAGGAVGEPAPQT